MCDIPVVALFPQCRERFELGSTGWSRVVGIDAVGGAPHCDFADEGRRVSSCCSPGWRAVTLQRVILDLVGKFGDQLGSLGQVGTPDRMGMEHFWNAREPRQRTPVSRHELWEAPVEDGGHVACRVEFATGGRCLEVEEWVFSALRRQVEEVCAQGRPGGLVGEVGDDLAGLGVERLNDLWSMELLGCDVEAVDVALDRLEKPGRWIAELPQHSAGGDRRFIAGEDLLQGLGRRAG